MTLVDYGSLRIDEIFLSDHDALFERLRTSITWDERIRSRKAASFGSPYNYSGTIWPETAFPDILAPVLDRVESKLGYRPTNCLALYYPDGKSSMGFHADAVDQLSTGTGIAVVSLGAERTISFRHPVSREFESYQLKSGSLIHMTAEMQAEWKHAILVEKHVKEGRISLTFRSVIREK